MRRKSREFCNLFFVLSLLSGILFSAVSVLTPNYSGRMIDAVAGGSDIVRQFWIFGGLAAAQFALSILARVAADFFSVHQKQRMRGYTFRHFLAMPMANREQRASVVSFVNNDIPAIVAQFYQGIIDIANCGCLVLLSVASLFSIHWGFAVLILASSVWMLLSPQTVKRSSQKARKGYSDAMGIYNAGLQSFLEGSAVIRVFRYRQRAEDFQEDRNRGVSLAETLVNRYRWRVLGLTSIAEIAKKVAILILGAVLIHRGELQIGALIAVVQLEALVGAPIEVMADIIRGMNEIRPLRARYREYFFTSEDTGNVSGEISGCGIKEGGISGPQEVSAIHTLEIRNLTYRIEDIVILDHIHLRFEGGGKYAIIGESGCGKSTLLRLIAQIGNLDYTGEILWDGRDIREFPPEIFYQRLSIAFQEPFLFYATLKENILLGREVSEETYRETIQKLNLQTLLDRCSGEMDPGTLENLSGGEKQRIALARVMVGKPEVYLLDEITSALDAENAKMMEEALHGEDAMILEVSHKISESDRERYTGIYRLR